MQPAVILLLLLSLLLLRLQYSCKSPQQRRIISIKQQRAQDSTESIASAGLRRHLHVETQEGSAAEDTKYVSHQEHYRVDTIRHNTLEENSNVVDGPTKDNRAESMHLMGTSTQHELLTRRKKAEDEVSYWETVTLPRATEERPQQLLQNDNSIEGKDYSAEVDNLFDLGTKNTDQGTLFRASSNHKPSNPSMHPTMSLHPTTIVYSAL